MIRYLDHRATADLPPAPVPLNTHRVEGPIHIIYVEAQTCSRWCVVYVRRGSARSGVPSSSLDHGSKLRGPSPISFVALDCDVHITSSHSLRNG
ncbi:hypothetical protein TNCV_2003491 [Trichonephila clavipes]|nr:hypothetical protein TNCV_2003491 [Trichonephila clavipes]